jgi:4-hydroxy-2-oxoheptanedioate aldolase
MDPDRRTFRDLLNGTQPILGGWCAIPSGFATEILARSFDWICIDMQHGLAGQGEMVSMLQSVAIRGTPALVRVPWNDPGAIMRALDGGAQGVIVPMVNSASEARQAVGACKYAPDGYRSWGPSRNALYGQQLAASEINKRVACVVMVETTSAIAAVDDIASVEGVDGVFVGPSDLAVAIGVSPAAAASDSHHLELVTKVAQACHRNQVVAGIMCDSADMAISRFELGFRMLALRSDARLLQTACESITQEVRRGVVRSVAGASELESTEQP